MCTPSCSQYTLCVHSHALVHSQQCSWRGSRFLTSCLSAFLFFFCPGFLCPCLPAFLHLPSFMPSFIFLSTCLPSFSTSSSFLPSFTHLLSFPTVIFLPFFLPSLSPSLPPSSVFLHLPSFHTLSILSVMPSVCSQSCSQCALSILSASSQYTLIMLLSVILSVYFQACS